MKTHICPVRWVDLVNIYQYARTYQDIPNGLSTMAIFAN